MAESLESSFFHAIQLRQLSTVRKMIKSIKLNEPIKVSGVWCTYLNKAVRVCSEPIVRLLLNHGAQVNLCEGDQLSPLQNAILNKRNDRIINILLEHGANINYQNQRGMSCLHMAVTKKLPEVVSLLLSKGADINPRDMSGKTPFHYAIEQRNNIEVVRVLIQHGVDVNEKSEHTPLIMALQSKNYDTAALLILSGADVSYTNDNGYSPLRSAVTRQCVPMVQIILIEMKVINLSEQPDILHTAVQKPCSKIVKMLIDRGADVNKKNHDGNTPLHMAVQYPRRNTIMCLVENGANINETNDKNTTPLYEAAKYGRKDNVELLLLLGADVQFEQSEVADHVLRGNRPEHTGPRMLIRKELLRLKAAGLLRKSMLPYVEEVFPGMEALQTSCLTEMERMKEELCPDHWVTWFDILRCKGEKVSRMLQNGQLKQKLKVTRIERKFPVYGGVLKRKIVNGSRVAQLEVDSFRVLSRIFTNVPEEITRMIMRYLSAEDKKTLVSC